jgi:hypothetical protein
MKRFEKTCDMGSLLSRDKAPSPRSSLPSVTRRSGFSPDPWLCVPTSRWVCYYREGALLYKVTFLFLSLIFDNQFWSTTMVIWKFSPGQFRKHSKKHKWNPRGMFSSMVLHDVPTTYTSFHERLFTFFEWNWEAFLTNVIKATALPLC